MRYDLQQIDKLSVEKKLIHENEKTKVCLFNLMTSSIVHFHFS